MSSLRNSLHRRNHKERSQLSHRQRFGILEKHKDYVLRARDYHSKQDRIQRLRRKAADRNKDEFYFGMNRQRTQEGVHIQDRGNSSLPVDMVKILKTQDENYVRTMRAAGLKKIEKLKDQLNAHADLFEPSTRRHVVFIENEEEGVHDTTDDAAAPERSEEAKTQRTRLLKKLSARLHRDRMLRYTERELEMQKLLMCNGRSKKLKGVERVDGPEEGSEDEDAEDAGKGFQSRTRKGVEDKAYKPRVYKWRAERKK